MEPAATFNKTSLHYRFANTYGTLDQHVHWKSEPITVDICTYIKCVFAGVGAWGLAMVVAMFFGAVVGEMLAWWAAMIAVGEVFDPKPVAMIGTMVLFGLWIFATAWWIVRRHEDKENRSGETETPPSFIGQAWRAFKDKMCVNIELK